MTRKSVALTLGIVAFLVLGVGGTLALLILHEPADYRALERSADEERLRHSRQFQATLSQIYNNLQEEVAWREAFTQDQINGYFQEDFVRSGVDRRVLPDPVSDPRVALGADGARLAFRYRVGRWSTVVSIDLALWLAPRELNVAALEIRRVRLGALPVSTQTLMKHLQSVAERNNTRVDWYRHEGNPVALLRFQADRGDRPSLRLETLEVKQGQFVLGARTLDGSALRAMRQPRGARPLGN